ncbi:MAG: NAD(P)H-dependent oxidoreductase [Promethearchaeota archaeon]
MKVLAINSSPNMDEGNTALILNPFLNGMKEAGADVELFHTKELKINPCQGEYNCWMKTPGQCYQNDDMQKLYPKFSADVIVFATPLYVDGMNGSMKNLIDRTIALSSPFIELRDGHCRHPLSEDNEGVVAKKGKVVLVSNCGFWERDNFEPLIVHLKAICKNMNREFAGALLRPHGSSLGEMLKMGAPVKDVLEAAEEAGRELVSDGKMSEKTLRIVSRELMPLEMFIRVANQHIKQELKVLNKTGSGEQNMKVKVNVSGVQRSLLFCLWARAKFSKMDNPILNDSKAVEIVENLIDYDFGIIDAAGFPLIMYVATVVRARMFDDTIKKFTMEHPEATIVNLGAGLDTTFFRVDNGSIKWYDLDFPDVITIRKKIIPESDRMKCLAKSLLNANWMDDIKDIQDGILFIAGGLLYHIEETEIKILFSKLADYFPGGEIVFDIMSPFSVAQFNNLIQNSGISAKWGIDDTNAFSEWDPRISIIEDYTFYSRIENKSYWGEDIARLIDENEKNRGAFFIHLKFR